MIDYSISVRPAMPGESGAVEMKAYPVAQINETMTLQQFAEHIASHGSVYSRDVVGGVLSKSVDCLREMILSGIKVELGDLGVFYVTLRTKAAPTAAEVTAANIKDVNVVWKKSKYFQNLIKDAEFRLVASRQAQAQAIAEQKGEQKQESDQSEKKNTVVLTAMPEGFGKVEGGGEYLEKSTVAIRAIPRL